MLIRRADSTRSIRPYSSRFRSYKPPNQSDIFDFQKSILGINSSSNIPTIPNTGINPDLCSPLRARTSLYSSACDDTFRMVISTHFGDRQPFDKSDPYAQRRALLEKSGLDLRTKEGESTWSDILARLGVTTYTVPTLQGSNTCISGPSASSPIVADAIASFLSRSSPPEIHSWNPLETLSLSHLMTTLASRWGYEETDANKEPCNIQMPEGRDMLYPMKETERQRFMKCLSTTLDRLIVPEHSAIITSGNDQALHHHISQKLAPIPVPREDCIHSNNATASDIPSRSWKGNQRISLRDSYGDILQSHPLSDLHHAAIFWPAPPESLLYTTDDSIDDMAGLIRSLILFKSILGDGSDFVTGGPGVGLTSWMHQNVLPIRGMRSAQTLLETDMGASGIFGVILSSDFQQIPANDVNAFVEALPGILDGHLEDIITEETIHRSIRQMKVKALRMAFAQELEMARRYASCLNLKSPVESLDITQMIDSIVMKPEQVCQAIRRWLRTYHPVLMTW